MSVSAPSTQTKKVNAIAIAPGSGVLGDAIGLELFNLGANVLDSNQAKAVTGRAGITEFEITSTKGYEFLKSKGIDAVLVAKSIMSLDGTPESASVRVTSTSSGAILAGITWENGWGGQRGSVADRTMRKNTSSAARQIARELGLRLGLQ